MDSILDDAVSPVVTKLEEYTDPDSDGAATLWHDFRTAPPAVRGRREPYIAPHDPVMENALEAVKQAGPAGKARVQRVFAVDSEEPGARVVFADGSHTDYYPDIEDPDAFYVAQRFDAEGNETSYTSQTSYDELSAQIRDEASAADPGYVASPDDLTEGLYVQGDEMYRVSRAGTGRLVAERLRESDGGWAPAPINRITHGHRAHLDEVAQRGAATGRCVLCGRPLSGASASKGVGPKCAAKYGS